MLVKREKKKKKSFNNENGKCMPWGHQETSKDMAEKEMDPG